MNVISQITIEAGSDGKYYWMWPDGEICSPPYKTSSAAQGELTKYKKLHTQHMKDHGLE